MKNLFHEQKPTKSEQLKANVNSHFFSTEHYIYIYDHESNANEIALHRYSGFPSYKVKVKAVFDSLNA